MIRPAPSTSSRGSAMPSKIDSSTAFWRNRFSMASRLSRAMPNWRPTAMSTSRSCRATATWESQRKNKAPRTVLMACTGTTARPGRNRPSPSRSVSRPGMSSSSWGGLFGPGVGVQGEKALERGRAGPEAAGHGLQHAGQQALAVRAAHEELQHVQKQAHVGLASFGLLADLGGALAHLGLQVHGVVRELLLGLAQQVGEALHVLEHALDHVVGPARPSPGSSRPRPGSAGA